MPPYLAGRLKEAAIEELARRSAKRERAAEDAESAHTRAAEEWRSARRPLRFYGNNKAFYQSKDTPVILSGPAETGKTIAALGKLDDLMWAYPGAQGAIIRSTYQSMPGSVLQTYEKKVLAENTPVEKYGGEKPQFYDYPNGSRVWVGGMDKPSKALSSERDVVYINQAEELTIEQFETLMTRATGRAGNMPKAFVFGDCNPGASIHWIKGKEASAALKLIESRHEDNPVLFDPQTGHITEQGKRTIAILDALTGVLYLRLRKGIWASAEGLVYDTWDRAVHMRDEPPAEIKYHLAGVDWGFTNPGVIGVWGIDGDKRMVRVREIYRTRRTIDWWIVQAKQLRDLFHIRLFVCDPSEPGYIQQFRNAGLPCTEAFNDISLGIQNVQQRLVVQPDGNPRLMYLRDALIDRDEDLFAAHKPTCSEEEKEVYVWPKGADGRARKEVPVDDNNHGQDQERYVAAYVDDLGHYARDDDDTESWGFRSY